MELNQIYTKGWMESRGDPKGDRYKSAQVISKTLVRDLEPKSVLDLGCGACNFANALYKQGCDVLAVDGSNNAEKMAGKGVEFECFDLRKPFKIDGSFDLVLSVEVLEHIDPKHEGTALSNIVSHVSKHAVITAAKLGQSGFYHMNCQPREHWVQRLKALGLRIREDLEVRWRKEWKEAGVLSCYIDNLTVWEKK